MKKVIMISTLIFSMNIISLLGLNMSENGLEIKDTFRIYVTNPVKV